MGQNGDIPCKFKDLPGPFVSHVKVLPCTSFLRFKDEQLLIERSLSHCGSHTSPAEAPY